MQAFVDRVINEAIDARLYEPQRRQLLLAGLPPAFIASLPVLDTPGETLRSDVLHLERTPALLGCDRRPLAIWLHNAAEMTKPAPVAQRFADWAIRCRAVATAPAATNAYVSSQLFAFTEACSIDFTAPVAVVCAAICQQRGLPKSFRGPLGEERYVYRLRYQGQIMNEADSLEAQGAQSGCLLGLEVEVVRAVAASMGSAGGVVYRTTEDDEAALRFAVQQVSSAWPLAVLAAMLHSPL